MTTRDRIVLMVVAVAAVLVAVWIEVVSPERQQANKLGGQVAAAHSHLTSAEGQLAHARSAESQYSSAYAAMVNLGKAVPPTQEVPALIDELSQASQQKAVNFQSIASGAGSGSGAAGGAAASSTTSASAATAAAGGISAVPFTFTFEGSYFDLEHLFHQLAGFATLDTSGEIEVSGRLLTIQSVSLTPVNAATTAASGSQRPSKLSGTITASAYVLPAGPASTAPGGSSAAGATPTSGSSPASSTTAPAVVKVTP
jgi:hypothetical protein